MPRYPLRPMTRYPHAEMDRMKRQQEAEKREAEAQRSREWRENQAKAKALLPALFEHERFPILVAKCSATPAKMRTELKSLAHWQPKKVLGLAEQWGIAA